MTDVLRYTAFSSDPRGGNPAGVVLDADDLDTARMQEIAAEVGYSETAFVLREGRPPGRYGLRFFSLLDEVPFCGHATIATAVAIAERDGVGPLVFETPVGPIEVDTRYDGTSVTASLRSVATHSRPTPPDLLAEALAALRWSAADLAADLPSHISFAGNDHLVLAAATRQRLASLDYDFDRLKALMTREGWTTVQLVWLQDDGLVHSRNPFPVGGVVEDPATGAAAAALGGYLIEIGRVDRPRTITVVQGEDMGRPSTLLVDVRPGTRRVVVTGTAVDLSTASLASGAGRREAEVSRTTG